MRRPVAQSSPQEKQSSRSPQVIKNQQSLSPSSSPRSPHLRSSLSYGNTTSSTTSSTPRISLRWLCLSLMAMVALIFVMGTMGLFFVGNPWPSSDNKAQDKLLEPPTVLNQDQEEIQREIQNFLFDNNHQDPSSVSPTIQHLLETWESPLVHIVNTRFMQEQGHLKALGRARFYLFTTFCLPTMRLQSTQDFLWIIKTDLQLDVTLLHKMVHLLQPYSNIYLVASNQNYMIRNTNNNNAGNSWRDGAEIQDLLHAPIYTGNITRLYQAMLQTNRQVILETRLDADDGLHKYYLKQIQDKAIDQFLSTTSEPPKWLYWCTRRHVEWHGGAAVVKNPALLPGKNQTLSQQELVDYYGSLLVVEHSKLCITPGITVGFGIGTPADQVPIHAHDKLFQEIRSLAPHNACGYEHVKDCLELVEDFLLVAVRARTPTSAGMQRVEMEQEEQDNDTTTNNTTTTKNNKKKKKKKHHKPTPPHVSSFRMYLYWDLLHDDFGVLREQIKYTNRYILDHLVPIAKDNLQGQCTSDHSCKNETKDKLLKIIAENGG
ncbi:expressed unknown protein [Seminavis robusta]|uniref:Uncharacterized protein n=1 Tax=Seminavis robusta TaxID=568900 RepID=A0A9N8ENF0_9STRA|nr:expressed unknown protein [Seminavis robusta]|eukprot:Sro1225_g254090.1 n/a (545) ;mRNA; f:11081-12830